MISLAADPAEQERQQFGKLSSGWAIGTEGWRRTIAREHRHLALKPGFEALEVREIKEQRWRDMLENLLREFGRSPQDMGGDPPEAEWKIMVAFRLRRDGVPYRWISEVLGMRSPSAARGHVYRYSKQRTA